MRFRRSYVALAALAAWISLLPHRAMASYAGTGAPWDTVGQKFVTALSGPIPFLCLLVVSVGTFVGIAQARNEMGAVLSGMLSIVFVGSILLNLIGLFTWMGGAGAVL